MTETFDREIRHLRHELRAARQALFDLLDQLEDDDLDRARRGGWPIARVVQHIIDSEWHYARLVARLREGEPPVSPERPGPPATVTIARQRLKVSRATLLAALDGVDEDAFYALQADGGDGYSVVSVLENVIHHDGEHRDQVAQILRTTGAQERVP